MRSNLGSLVSAVAFTACSLGSLPAHAITRCDVMAHAQAWIDAGVMYSQGPSGGYCPGALYCDPNAGNECYRPDCSGFVSAVWGLPAPGHTTYSFAGGPWDDGVSYAIGSDQLAPGDAINFGGDPNMGTGHVMLFGGWINSSTLWVFQENLCNTTANYEELDWGSLASQGYLPIRYTGIEECGGSGARPEHDVNGDGRSDFVSAGGDGSAHVWLGQASGQLGADVSSFGGTLDSANVDGSGHYIVGVADVTGDGKADLVSASTDGSAYVWTGQADGSFGGNAVSSFGGTLDSANVDGSGHYIVGVADVTGDGKADLVSARDDGSAYVWTGQADGSFGGNAVSSFGGTLDSANVDGTGYYIVGVADVTGDRKADLVGVSGDGSASVWPGQAGGDFGTAVPSFGGTVDFANVDGSGYYIVDVADVTADGMADLIGVGSDGSASVWPGQAGGDFGAAVSSLGGMLDFANIDGTGHYILGVADITGDGSGDLVSLGSDGNAYVWPGSASGAFGSAVAAFGGPMDFANQDDTGHYVVAPVGPGGLATMSGSSSSGGWGEDDPPPDPTAPQGCACRAGASPKSSPWAMGFVAALTWIAAARRRRSVRAMSR